MSSSTCTGRRTDHPVLRFAVRRRRVAAGALHAPVVQPSGHRVRRKRALEARRGQRHRLARRVVPGEPGAGPQQRDKRNAANAKRLGQGALRVHVDAAKQSAHAALSALHAQPVRCRSHRPKSSEGTPGTDALPKAAATRSNSGSKELHRPHLQQRATRTELRQRPRGEALLWSSRSRRRARSASVRRAIACRR